MKKAFAIATIFVAATLCHMPPAHAAYDFFTPRFGMTYDIPSGMPLYEGYTSHRENLRVDATLRLVDLVAAYEVLLRDMSQTKRVKEELNPVLTKHPSDARIHAYFAGWLYLVTRVAPALLPDPPRGFQWYSSFIKSVTFTEQIVTERNDALERGEFDRYNATIPALGIVLEWRW